MQEYFLAERGIAYRTNTFVPGRATLLLVHGFSASSSGWREFEPLWEQKYNLLIPDLRGHGKSKRYPDFRDYAAREHAADLYALLAATGTKECVAVGYSLGVELALELALAHKTMVQKLVLIGPLYRLSSLWRIRLGRPLLWIVAKFCNVLPPNLYLRGYVDYQQFKNSGDASLGRIWADFARTGPRAYFHSLRQIFNFPDDRYWSTVPQPTLILCGAHDTLSPPANALSLVQSMQKAELRVVGEGDHMLPYHNAGAVAAAIEQFVG